MRTSSDSFVLGVWEQDICIVMSGAAQNHQVQRTSSTSLQINCTHTCLQILSLLQSKRLCVSAVNLQPVLSPLQTVAFGGLQGVGSHRDALLLVRRKRCAYKKEDPAHS